MNFEVLNINPGIGCVLLAVFFILLCKVGDDFLKNRK